MADQRTKGEQEFIDQYTRSLTVNWADQCIRGGGIPDVPGIRDSEYWEYALSKGWITKSDPRRLTAIGFKTAAAFLRR